MRFFADQIVDQNISDEIFSFVAQIFPICRSITGNNVRQTLRKIAGHIPLEIHEVPTGTPIFDWTVPREWNIRDAYIKDFRGNKVVDFAQSSLHVMSYSTPVRKCMPLADLKQHIYTLPEQPDLIPYRTSYYAEEWAFCMAHRELESLQDGIYEVVIDSTLQDGYLTYGEYLYKGETEDEFLLSAHICHPSLANDNCSGVALLTHLAKRMIGLKTRYSYRFVFAPGTIGAITWLARNEKGICRIKHGLVISMVGDGGGPSYKKSRRGDAAIDRALIHVLGHFGLVASVAEFSPYGYDERQYCSPGFNLPVGLFQRSRYGTIPQYHTSADNLDFVRPEHLAESYRIIAQTLDVIENDGVYYNTNPKCEPQLGKRGLYGPAVGDTELMTLLWVLNLADGTRSLLDIAERSKLPFDVVRGTAQKLQEHSLLTGPQ
jgi:aminopeptidase-like protein